MTAFERGALTRARSLAAICVLAVASWTCGARAQEPTGLEIADTTFAEQPLRAPISYFTTYDLNVSRSTWTQMLSYNHSGKRVTFGADGTTNVLTPVRGLETEGKDASIAGRLNVRATARWLWSLDGLFDTSSNEDARSSTKRRQNKVQLRTSYSATILPGLSGTALAFSELQREQGLSRKTIPGPAPSEPDTVGRDSTYTSGRRDGVSGTLRWTPEPWLEVTGLGTGNWNDFKTETWERRYFPVDSGGGSDLSREILRTYEIPTGDRRFETTASYRGVPKTLLRTSLRSRSGTQTMYVFAKSNLDRLSWYDRSANVRLEHTPMPGGGVVLEGSFGQVFREYVIQPNFNTLARTASGSANLFLYQPSGRVTAGFQLNRVENTRQELQNGTVINRAMNAGGARRITDRFWLEGAGTLSLFSRRYEDPKADRDDFRGYANVGGGYRVSSLCSTAVHFSVTRAHAVAIDRTASGNNNVQTSYQMDALLRLQITRTFQILQNYQINSNYFIYDFDFQEGRNTLSRIRRIDTVLSDSLFDFASLRVTHNFFTQDLGSYAPEFEGGPRKYLVTQEFFIQNLGVTLGVRPVPGIVLSATQILGNTRNYTYSPSRATSTRNRWTLNLGAHVDRTLPGDLVLQGSIQRIGEYTEVEDNLPVRDQVDYWLAGASLQKYF